MKKKFLSLVLVSTMVLGSAITAFAADGTIDSMAGTGTGQEITGDAEVAVPTIKITVPTSVDIKINPYKIKATVGEKQISDQIATVPQEIKNESNVGVAVNIENLKAKSDTVAVSASSLAGKSGAKAVFLYLDVQDGAADSADFTRAYDAKTMIACPAAAAGATDDKIKAVSKTNVVTLSAGDQTATKASFKMRGDVVVNPTKTENKTTVADPWTDSDTVSFGFKFTFTPQVNAGE